MPPGPAGCYGLDMSLDQIEMVVAIAEEGALVRAARRLAISQPPLTRKLAALEDELGVALFERLPRGMRPTPAGEAFLPVAHRILADVGRARAAARGARAGGRRDTGGPQG